MRRAGPAKGIDARISWRPPLPLIVALLVSAASACSTGRTIQDDGGGPGGTDGATSITTDGAPDRSDRPHDALDAAPDTPRDGADDRPVGTGGSGSGGSDGGGLGGSGSGGTGTGGTGSGGTGTGGASGAPGSGGHLGTGGAGTGGMGVGGSGTGGSGTGGAGGSCQPPLKLCGTTCVATASDPANCGNCGIPCPTNEQCVTSACQCVSPRLLCGNACVDPGADPHNCGACGHDCLGGTCSAGHCQPVAVTTTLAAPPTVFGVDATNVYFSMGTTASNGAYRAGKTAVAGVSTPIITGLAVTFPGVIGDSLLLRGAAGGGGVTLKVCSVSACVVPSGTFITGDDAIPFRTAVPSFFATNRLVNPGSAGSGTADIFFDWWGAGALARESTTMILNGGVADLRYFAGGDSVYWIYNNASSTMLAVSELNDNNVFYLAGGMATNIGWSIVDANAQSVLLLSSTNVLYRALISVHSSAPPAQLAALPGSTTGFAGATEDASLVYWLDGQGTAASCAPAGCPGTQATIATGQTSPSGFYQDATALYWGRGTPNAVMRLAK